MKQITTTTLIFEPSDLVDMIELSSDAVISEDVNRLTEAGLEIVKVYSQEALLVAVQESYEVPADASAVIASDGFRVTYTVTPAETDEEVAE